MLVDERLEVVRRCPAFVRVAPEVQRALAEALEEERFGAGEVVTQRGEEADAAYLVAEGRLLVQVDERPGVAATRTMGLGELVGEYGMFQPGVRTANVTALEKTVLLRIDYARLHAFLLQFPVATLALLATAVARLVEAEQRNALAPR